MKNNLKELDVDFIGDAEPLTKSEENRISEYIRKNKNALSKKVGEKAIRKKSEKTS